MTNAGAELDSGRPKLMAVGFRPTNLISSQSVLDEYGHLINRDFLWQNTDVVLPIAVFR